MDSDGLPIVGAGIDYTRVEPIQHKRTLAFVNHFVMHTVGLLNHFSNSCERKLAEISRRITRMETIMSILETKLASIPGLEEVQASEIYVAPANLQNIVTRSQSTASNSAATAQPSSVQPAAQAPAPAAAGQPANANANSSPAGQEGNAGASAGAVPVDTADEQAAAPPPPPSSANTVAKDPRYKKYLQLTKVGVPMAQFAAKMRAEGLDPDLLENPDSVVPEAHSAPPLPSAGSSSSDNDEESEDSDFSD